jgi:hypothetical protein
LGAALGQPVTAVVLSTHTNSTRSSRSNMRS